MDKLKQAWANTVEFVAKWWGLALGVLTVIGIAVFQKRGRTIAHLQAEVALNKATKQLEKLETQEKIDTNDYLTKLNAYLAAKHERDSHSKQ